MQLVEVVWEDDLDELAGVFAMTRESLDDVAQLQHGDKLVQLPQLHPLDVSLGTSCSATR